jgi:hypothetical protein
MAVRASSSPVLVLCEMSLSDMQNFEQSPEQKLPVTAGWVLSLHSGSSDNVNIRRRGLAAFP